MAKSAGKFLLPYVNFAKGKLDANHGMGFTVKG